VTIVDLLPQHPEGLSPAQVRQGLRVEKDLADTMGGMARDGILDRIETGRYTVVGVEETMAKSVRHFNNFHVDPCCSSLLAGPRR
jgi:hypothetical protein